MTKDELLEALMIERHNGIWWRRSSTYDTLPPSIWDDSQLTTARRRRALVDQPPAAYPGGVSVPEGVA